jgi:hypothetical protein
LYQIHYEIRIQEFRASQKILIEVRQNLRPRKIVDDGSVIYHKKTESSFVLDEKDAITFTQKKVKYIFENIYSQSFSSQTKRDLENWCFQLEEKCSCGSSNPFST